MPAGYQLLVDVLIELEINVVFGLPGSETVEVFDELRRKKLRAILSTSEREASFMAIGHYGASGRVAGLCTIGGPGFTNALTGVAEALEDSAALLYLLIIREKGRQRFGLHSIDHRAAAAPLTKAYYTVEAATDLEKAVRAAHAEATTGEPGPVIVELTRPALIGSADRVGREETRPYPDRVASEPLEKRLQESRRPVLFVGNGALDASDQLTKLAETLHCPVFTTGSGRGSIPDRHPLHFGASFGQDKPGEVTEAILGDSDLIIALGCKLTHNGSFGHNLSLPQEKLARVDASADVLKANYPASISLVADVPLVVDRLWNATQGGTNKEWESATLQKYRERAEDERRSFGNRDEGLKTPDGAGPAALFEELRSALPDDAQLVTDSGLHQFLARTHFEVRQPRTLLFPADYQSMGFGIPAALGAQVATPERTTVAIVGDGGFAMTALELATAQREKLPIKVLVFTNGTLELIRESQITKRGAEYAIRLLNPDLALFAKSLGIPFARWEDLTTADLQERFALPSPVLIEVKMAGTRMTLANRATGRARAFIEPRLSPRIFNAIRQRRGRRR